MSARKKNQCRRQVSAQAAQTSFDQMKTSSPSPLEALCDDCMRASVLMGAETLRFVQLRAKKDFDLWQDLVACKDPMQAYDCQRQFYSQMLNDYMEEAARLFSIANQTDDYDTAPSMPSSPGQEETQDPARVNAA